jgi:hypothetical protein
MKPTLTVNIVAPHANEQMGGNLFAIGTVEFEGNGTGTFKSLTGVTVQFGQNELARIATLNGASWQCTGTVPRNAYFVPNSSFYPDDSLARS